MIYFLFQSLWMKENGAVQVWQLKCYIISWAWIYSLFFSLFFFPNSSSWFIFSPCFSAVPPHAEVTGYSGDWFMGLRNAALRCVTGGNPTPKITWIRYRRTRLPLCLVLGWLIVWGAWSYVSRRFQDNCVYYSEVILAAGTVDWGRGRGGGGVALPPLDNSVLIGFSTQTFILFH